jgi:hypothetical protein
MPRRRSAFHAKGLGLGPFGTRLANYRAVAYPGAGEPSLQACHTVADWSMAANPEYTATCTGDVELAEIRGECKFNLYRCPNEDLRE